MRLHTERNISMILGILGCLALALTFGRCSPVAPSIQKHSYVGIAANPENDPLQLSGPPAFSFETTVKPAPASDHSHHDEAKLSDSEVPLTDVQTSELRDTGHTNVELKTDKPFDYVEIVVEVSLPEREIRRQKLAAFKIALKPIHDNHYQLSVKPGVDQNVATAVLKELQGVKLTLTNQSQDEARRGTTHDLTASAREFSIHDFRTRVAFYSFYL